MGAAERRADLLRELATLRAELASFLGLAHTAGTSDAQLAAAWARCERGAPGVLERVGSDRTDAATRAELVHELESLQRLNAFATAAVAARRARVAEELGVVRAAARRLDRFRPRPASGDTCDLAG